MTVGINVKGVGTRIATNTSKQIFFYTSRDGIHKYGEREYKSAWQVKWNP